MSEMYLLVLAINVAEALRFRLEIPPKGLIKKDVKESFQSLDKLQSQKVKGEDTFLDMFQENIDSINAQTSNVLKVLGTTLDAYITAVFCIDLAITRATKSKKRSDLLISHYIERTYIPMRKYYTEEHNALAEQLVEEITKIMNDAKSI